MFTHTHYVPILKGKRGELSALRELTDVARARLTPLIEINERKDTESIQNHLDGLVDSLIRSWIDLERPFFLDFGNIDDGDRMDNGTHFLNAVFTEARSKGLKLIPVTNFNHDQDFQQQIRAINAEDANGVCLRFSSEQIVTQNFSSNLTTLLQTLDLAPAKCDFVIDFGYLSDDRRQSSIYLLNSILNTLPSISDWRTLTVASTSFPMVLSDVSRNSTTYISRIEWAIWNSLVNNRGAIRRLPTFGDYAIQHPELVDFDPVMMQVRASIRYTIKDDWLIIMGVSLRDRTLGYDQYYNLAQQLVARSEYCGAGFSYGDNYINECANMRVSHGSPEVWRRVGTNHHLTFVTNQISNLPGL